MSANRACHVCGCTDEHACNPPCVWFGPTLCSVCAMAAEALREWARAAVKPSLTALIQEADIPRRAIDLKRFPVVAVDRLARAEVYRNAPKRDEGET